MPGHAIREKYLLHEIEEQGTAAHQPPNVCHHDGLYPSHLDFLHHILRLRAVKGGSGKAYVHEQDEIW